jgi:hypothetical protein
MVFCSSRGHNSAGLTRQPALQLPDARGILQRLVAQPVVLRPQQRVHRRQLRLAAGRGRRGRAATTAAAVGPAGAQRVDGVEHADGGLHGGGHALPQGGLHAGGVAGQPLGRRPSGGVAGQEGAEQLGQKGVLLLQEGRVCGHGVLRGAAVLQGAGGPAR